MGKEEQLIRDLSEITGADIALTHDQTCEVAVDDRIVMLRYRDVPDDDWLYFSIVSQQDGEVPRGVLAKALSLDLFGAETLGLHLGLFGNALILSGTLDAAGLTAETLAERIVFLARHAASLEEKLGEQEPEESLPLPDPLLAAFGNGFIAA